MSFVPTKNVESIWNKIEREIVKLENVHLSKFAEYFKRTYIGEKDEFGIFIYKPTYNITFWNLYDRVINFLPRTINGVESWHRTLNKIGEISHPNIAKFIEIIQKMEEISRFTIGRLEGGKFSSCRVDIKKEWDLRMIVVNFHIFNTEAVFFELLDGKFQWNDQFE